MRRGSKRRPSSPRSTAPGRRRVPATCVRRQCRRRRRVQAATGGRGARHRPRTRMRLRGSVWVASRPGFGGRPLSVEPGGNHLILPARLTPHHTSRRPTPIAPPAPLSRGMLGPAPVHDHTACQVVPGAIGAAARDREGNRDSLFLARLAPLSAAARWAHSGSSRSSRGARRRVAGPQSSSC